MTMTTNRTPDKWLVYVACCLVALFDFPLTLTFGALYVSLLDKYGETRFNTAVVQSVFIGCSSIASVVSGALIKRFGAARVSFIGSTLLPAGFMLSYVATSILALDILIGVIAGLGTCFLFVSSTVVVGTIFEGTTKEIALSIHNALIGLGSILYPYLLNSLSYQYGVNGTFLILGAVFLNNIVVALIIFLNENRICIQNGSRSQKAIHDTGNTSLIKKPIGFTSSSRLKESTVTKPNVSCATADYKTLKNIDVVVKEGNQSHLKLTFPKRTSRPHLKTGTPKDEAAYIEVPSDVVGNEVIMSTLRVRVAQLMNFRYTVILLATSCVGAALGSYLVVFEDVFASKGRSSDDVQNQFLAFNIASMLSRALPIIFSRFKSGSDFVELLILGSLSGCIGQIVILLSIDTGLLYVGNFLSGLSLGSILSAGTIAVLNITPKHLCAVAFGLFVTLGGIETIVCGPLYGYIRDTTSSYSGAIILTAALNGTAALLYMALKLVNFCKTKTRDARIGDSHTDSTQSTTAHYRTI